MQTRGLSCILYKGRIGGVLRFPSGLDCLLFFFFFFSQCLVEAVNEPLAGIEQVIDQSSRLHYLGDLELGSIMVHGRLS